MSIRVLCVDDEESMLDLLKIFLERNENLKVEGVPSVDLALDALAGSEFDVIVSDYMMPGQDGIEFLKILRRQGSDTPFILFTGRGREEVAMEALNEGADFYLQKTGDAGPLYAELTHMIMQSYQRVSSERERAEIWNRFERLANTTPDLIWRIRVSPDLGVEYMNPACEWWVGYTPEDFYKEPGLLRKCVHPEDVDKVSQALENPSEYKQPMTTRWFHKDGTMRWAEDRWSAVRGKDGQVTVIEGISRDVTGRVRSEEALRQANRKLELVTSLVRHDTLNQASSILGQIELARTGAADSLVNCLDRIEASTKLIARQLSFSSDYQKTVSGSPIWVQVRDVIQAVLSGWDLRDVQVELELGDLEVLSDYSLDGVFMNLIDDSLTHGERVSRIEIRTEKTDGGFDIVYEDNGVGISQGEKELIFGKGYGKGTGYGLYLSREILAVSNITIEETGEPGKGARFVIHIPREACR